MTNPIIFTRTRMDARSLGTEEQQAAKKRKIRESVMKLRR
jgi:hypothetical protein